MCMCMCVCGDVCGGGWHACVRAQTLVRLCATLCTVALQTPLSMGFSRQDYWSGLPCLSSGDLPDPGIDSLSSPASAGRFFTTSATWEARGVCRVCIFYNAVVILTSETCPTEKAVDKGVISMFLLKLPLY